ncbi:MAG: hypothetical protein ACU0CO_07995 [Shimia sp.]
MRDPLKLHHPFFLPKWRRVATILIVAAWGLWELLTLVTWVGAVLLGLSAYLTWKFLIVFDPADYTRKD